ncbi:MAG: TolB family protein [Vicinamibacterales bacterium]
MTCQKRTRTIYAGVAALALAAVRCSGTAPSVGGPGGEMRALTGAHSRAAWVQGDGSDPRASGVDLVLMGFDSHDGKGERVILGKPASYVQPLFTPRGDRIVFSSRAIPGPPEVFVVNWDGTGLRTLASGFALDVWEHPEDGSEWVYVGTDNGKLGFAAVSRFRIDAPDKREIVWNKSVVGRDGFRVSADGRHASGLCPWPEATLAELPNGSMTKLGEGCWTSLINARGLLFWYFDGAHRNVTMVDVETGARWMVNINHAEGFDGAEVYHPRWSNHPRFLTISGPYNQGGPNQARTGGKQVEIYMGRFSEDFTKVEAWARVTNNSGGDSMPDVWIDLAKSPYPRRPSGPIGPSHLRATAETAGRPAGAGEAERLVVSVRLERPGPIPTPQEILPYRHALVVNDYGVVDVLQGRYRNRQIQIAQWAIRDSRELPDARRIAGAAFTLTVEKYDAHQELEGERLISNSAASTLPLYYDVGQR